MIEGIENLPPPGRYLVQVSDKGIRFIDKLTPIPAIKTKKAEKGLAECMQESGTNLSDLKAELARLGHLNGKKLLLNGPKLKALYDSLCLYSILPKNLSAPKVFRLFQSEFKLSFKHPRSMTGDIDSDKHFDNWNRVLYALKPS